MMNSPHLAHCRAVRWFSSSRFAIEARAVLESSPFFAMLFCSFGLDADLRLYQAAKIALECWIVMSAQDRALMLTQLYHVYSRLSNRAGDPGNLLLMLGEQINEPGFVVDGHAQLLGFGQLGTRVLADDQVVEALADAAGDGPTKLLNSLFGLRARQVLQPPGKQEALPGERSRCQRCGAAVTLHAHACCLQLLDHFTVARLLKPEIEAVADLGADTRERGDLLFAGRQQVVHCLK